MDEEVNLLLLDELLRHQVDVERFKHGHLLQLRAFLQKLMDDVSSQLGQRASDLQQGTRQNQRLTALLRDLTRLSDETADAMAELSRGQLRDLAALEGGYVITAAQLVLPVEVSFATVAPSVIWQTVQDAPMQGRIFDEWFQDYKVAQRNRIINQVRISVVEGETVDQTIRRIRGTKAAKHEDGVVQGINRRAAEALARTQINHTVTQARQATIGANSEVVSAVTWRSTLDGKTSEVCRARDGKVYPIDKGPRPPAHPNCRSTIVPVIKSWKELGIDLKEAPVGTRASMNGQVPATETYQTWLKRQSVAFQNEVLGLTKAKLFRDGGLTLDKFVDERLGRGYTLDQLRKRQPGAFAKAGL